MKLHLILPCSNADYTKNWTVEQVADFNRILGLIDSVEYISDRYYNGCMKNRNARLLNIASKCCISYWNQRLQQRYRTDDAYDSTERHSCDKSL